MHLPALYHRHQHDRCIRHATEETQEDVKENSRGVTWGGTEWYQDGRAPNVSFCALIDILSADRNKRHASSKDKEDINVLEINEEVVRQAKGKARTIGTLRGVQHQRRDGIS